MNRMQGVVLVAVLFCLAGGGPAVSAETAPSPDEQLLKFAPPGTWAVIFVDLKALRTSPLGELWPYAEQFLPYRLKNTVTLVCFLLPTPSDDSGREAWCGLLKTEGASRGELRQTLAKVRRTVKVEGLEAFQRGRRDVVAPIDDNSVLFGHSQNSLAIMIKAHRSTAETGMVSELSDMLKPLNGYTAYVAGCPPENRGQEFLEIPVVRLYDRRCTSSAWGVRVADGLEGRAIFRYSSTREAEERLEYIRRMIVTRAHQSIDAAQEPAGIPPRDPALFVMDWLRRTEIALEGREVHAILNVTQEKVERFVAVFQSARNEAYARARKGRSLYLLKRIAMAIAKYRNEYDLESPPNLEILVEKGYLESEKPFLDPSDDDPVQRGKKGLKYSYEYVGPIPKNAPPDIIICYGRKGIYPDGRNVLYLDMAVQWVSEDELHDPEGPLRTSLRACYTALMERFAGQLTEQQKARLKKFYEIEE